MNKNAKLICNGNQVGLAFSRGRYIIPLMTVIPPGPSDQQPVEVEACSFDRCLGSLAVTSRFVRGTITLVQAAQTQLPT